MKYPLLRIIGVVTIFFALIMTIVYARYVDWLTFDDTKEIREILPERYSIDDAYHYKLRSFMDTWDLYRFSTTPDAVTYLKTELNLESQGVVHYFPLIISKPPPYWWDPEQLNEAELFQSTKRASDGRHYELLYSGKYGIVYLIRFDG